MLLLPTSAAPVLVALCITGLFHGIPALADSGPGLLGSCAQRHDPLDCVPTKTAATDAEVAYLNNLHGTLQINDADLLAAGRRTCNMFVYAGQTTIRPPPTSVSRSSSTRSPPRPS